MSEPCTLCGSSDARKTFDNGSWFCYSCRKGEGDLPGGDPAKKSVKSRVKKTSPDLIDVEIRAIPKRGLRLDTCEKWGYGFGVLRGKKVHVAQYRDKNGVLVGQKTRTANKEFEVLGEIKSAGLYGEWLWRDGGKMIVVTEGEIDALSMSQLQDNRWAVVSLPQGAQSGPKAVGKSIEFLEKFEKVIFMLDQDDPGREAAIKCAEMLAPGKAYIATLPMKDVNEMLMADRGGEAVAAMWNARLYRPDAILMGDDLLDRMLTYHLGTGAPWPMRSLNERTKGMHAELGEVIGIVAGTGTGKSTFCKEVAAHLLKAGNRLGYISLEEPVERMGIGIASVLLNRPLHLLENAEIRAAGIEAAWAPYRDNLIAYDSGKGILAPAPLTAKIRYMARGCGVTHVILDHLSIVASGLDVGDDERRALDSTMTTIATLCQEMSVCVILVVHLRRPTGMAHEDGRRVSMSDIRGSGGIAQLCHTIVALERNQQAEGDDDGSTVVRVLKCRLTGSTGVAGELHYDEETGRLRETTTEFENEDVAGKDQAVPEVREPVRGAGEDQAVPGVRPGGAQGAVEPPVARARARKAGSPGVRGEGQQVIA